MTIRNIIKSKIPRSDKYKNLVRERDRYCVITGDIVKSSEVAHIIPFRDFKKHHADPYNGLLLTKSLHTQYDSLMWTFDFYDKKECEEDPDYYLMPIITGNINRNALITHYERDRYTGDLAYYKVPKRSSMFLYISYQTFIDINYGPVNYGNINIGNEHHRNAIKTVAEKWEGYTTLFPEEITNPPKEHREVRAIVGETSENRYIIVCEGRPWREKYEYPKNAISTQLIHNWIQRNKVHSGEKRKSPSDTVKTEERCSSIHSEAPIIVLDDDESESESSPPWKKICPSDFPVREK